ncbi:hypothetical protein [Mucilaginibacter phyllosphaerae]|uniref:Uncharacterized protein n=1 Tax=Mucilaginibacter phyllosphaerae TaxID=1812349 RepID=A0A4Y8A9R6_9SPHI|nr:hypothetical protein [Mucilaginibacter phyllosphaerae]MBB3969796.1 hypothetical protein [Mucilaginibacter phyllosphaerae]TEW65174.1 hypothetical protein E2R65_14770 [Mucilaginibacter phyllosphaerae]GGH17471.1 hypothetical protein GCM10007352_27640 [Mucilaginibacter phyllosphaerae]
MTSLPNPDNNDGREPLDWKSKYAGKALFHISCEASFLSLLLIGTPVLAFLFWQKIPQQLFGLNDSDCKVFTKYVITSLGGVFGGTLFDIKWLIHAVAKNKWHVDRRLWRLFVPFLSGGFALVFVLMLTTFVKIFDPKSVEASSSAFGFGFLVGYFTDSAIARLSDAAKNIFGNLEEHSR